MRSPRRARGEAAPSEGAWPHVPVMLSEVVEALAPRDGGVYVDCTCGMGGHTFALLERADCIVIGIDRDDDALRISKERCGVFGDRFVQVKGAFGDLAEILDAVGHTRVDGILADIGVSSLQLDTPDRGFSLRASGPLDMRMDTHRGPTAADLVNTLPVEDLERAIFEFGEERFARRVARTIVEGRPWSDTVQLAEAVAKAVPSEHRIHPATRTFQALRILVNDELGQLERLLPAAVEALRPGGHLVLLSFHSLEDRIVKRYFARESGRDAPKDPYGHPLEAPRLRVAGRALRPDPSDPNPRARSARLRSAERLT